MTIQRKLLVACVLLFLVLFSGTTGYWILGNGQWTWSDCVYMTVITLSTVGFGEVVPIEHNQVARIFTIILILSGMGILMFGISTATAFVVEGELTNILWRRKMSRKIKKLKDHIIICGGGKVALWIIKELIKVKRDIVVIELNEQRIEMLKKIEHLCILQGDALDEEVLKEAQIDKAFGLASVLAEDKDNLFLTITARQLNPKLRIIAKGIDPKAAEKLKKAGADSVVSPVMIGGMRIASEMVRPTVVTFLDMMLKQKDSVIRIEDVFIPANSKLVNLTLKEFKSKKTNRVGILAIKEKDSPKFIFNPPFDHILKPESTLVVMGEIDEVIELRKIAQQ